MPSLADSASTGDRLAALRTLRDVLADAIDRCDSLRDLASLSGRLQSVLEEIAELAPPVEVKGNTLDELDKRRTSRGAKPARKAGSASR